MKGQLWIIPLLILLTIGCKKNRFKNSEKYGVDIFETSDGSYVITGNSSRKDGYAQILLMCIDNNGNILWHNTFGVNDESEHGQTVLETTENEFIVFAQQNSRRSSKSDFLFIKTDKFGNKLSSKVVGGGPYDYVPSNMISTGTNQFLLSGTTYTPSNAVVDAYLVKINTNGDAIWTKQLNEAGIQHCNFVEYSQSSYYLTGNSDLETFLTAIDLNGNRIWSKKYKIGEFSGGKTLKKTVDGSIMLCGYSGEDDLVLSSFLLKLDSNGDSLWTKEFPGYYHGYNCLTETLDSGFVLLVGDYLNPSIVKTDSQGDIQWQVPFSTSGKRAYPNSIITTRNGELIVVGGVSTESNRSMLVVKLGENGNRIWSREY